MSALLSLRQRQTTSHDRWLIPPLLPQGQLVLLDGPAGVGKSLLASSLIAAVSLGETLRPIGKVLCLLSSQQQSLFVDFLAAQKPDYEHVYSIEFQPTSREGSIVADLLCFIEENIREHQPQMLLIDSLEELLQLGTEPQARELHDLWTKLRTLAEESGCVILIPRQNGLHELRQYGPFTRLGSSIAHFGLTLLFHPYDSRARVITIARNHQGVIGDQVRMALKHDGFVRMAISELHEHVRPARSLATWQPQPFHLQQNDEILRLTEDLMHGRPMEQSELENYMTKAGFSKSAFKRAFSQGKIQCLYDGKNWLYHPTEAMTARFILNRRPTPTTNPATSPPNSPVGPVDSVKDIAIAPENQARTRPMQSDTRHVSHPHTPPGHTRQAG